MHSRLCYRLLPSRRAAAAAVLCLMALALALPAVAQDAAAKASLAGASLAATLSETLTVTQPEAPAAAAAAVKQGVKLGPRTLSFVSTSRQLSRPPEGFTVPVDQVKPIEQRVKLSSLPKMRALTKSQMDRQYKQAAAPAAFHSARAGECASWVVHWHDIKMGAHHQKPDCCLGPQRLCQAYSSHRQGESLRNRSCHSCRELHAGAALFLPGQSAGSKHVSLHCGTASSAA